MIPWTIWYSDGSRVDGITEQDWNNAPSEDVQIIVIHAPYPDVNGRPFRPWQGVSDRMILTGEDHYYLNTWAVKNGKWMTDEAYTELWESVIHDRRNTLG